jgi:DNA-binding MarR family transcriptional regulator
VAKGANALGYFKVTPKPDKKSAKADHDSRRRSPLTLDRLIHERLRLGIVGALAVNDRLTFNDLKRLLQTTDGNLSVHARKLEEAGYIASETISEGRAQTGYRLTSAGSRAFEKYLGHMEAIIKAVRD